MIKETATVVRVEDNCLWVEGVQRSTCGSCTARAGCGQRLLAGVVGSPPLIRVLLSGHTGGRDCTDYHIGEEIEIGIPEDVVVKGSLLIYFLPLLSLLLAAGLAESIYGKDFVTVCAGVVGLVFGGLLVRAISVLSRNSARLQPTVMAITPIRSTL
ncbi:MAG: transcriptional regulator [Gammaproteobacteria bacterium]|nr:MAG: transcriptional regulator [Gammaproteobacteria bacterium]